jgi:hypothetical protein
MKIALPLFVLGLSSAACAAGAGPETVAAAHFDAVELQGGGHVVLKHGATQSVRLMKGSTAYTRIHPDPDNPNKLVIEACNSDCPHHYDLEVEIVTPAIGGVAISGGGSITSDGSFPSQHTISAAVHGGGAIDIKAIDAADATAAVECGGVILVRAKDGLTAAVNGGGRIKYWGNPRTTEAIDGGGSVSKGG